MKKALIIIDYVEDFVSDDGRLTCGKVGQDIDETIAGLIKEFHDAGDFIVEATDFHLENDPYNKERTMFPAHCFNEQGRSVYGKSGEVLKTVNPDQYIKIDKIRYSAFHGTTLDMRLKERNVREVHFVGVCTDICVLHGAVDAYNLGYDIVVYEKGVASFNQDGHNYCLNHFKNVLGATIK